MVNSRLNYNNYPPLKDKDEQFKALVANFVAELTHLSSEQKKKLGVFKAIELTNAVVQNLEKDRAPNSLGKTKAMSLFKIVRAAIRNRCLLFPDATVISLEDRELKKIIDRACVMFHAGKNDLEQKTKAVAFSMAQNIVLTEEINQGLQQFSDYYPELSNPQIRDLVYSKYIQPFL